MLYKGSLPRPTYHTITLLVGTGIVQMIKSRPAFVAVHNNLKVSGYNGDRDLVGLQSQGEGDRVIG